jgi:hypothetical protein
MRMLSDPCCPHLSQRGELLAVDPGAGSGDARELAGSAPLPEHGRPAGSTRRRSCAWPPEPVCQLPCGQRCALPTRAHHHRNHDPNLQNTLDTTFNVGTARSESARSTLVATGSQPASFGRCCERTSSPRDGSLHGAQGLWFGRVAAKARIVRRLGGRERMSRMSRADRWKEGTCGLSSLACSKVSESGRKVANIAGSSHRATSPNAHRRASPPSGSSLVLHVDSPREPATGCLPVHHMPGRPSRMRREKSGAPAAARARSLIRLARRSSAKGRPWSSAPYS